MGILSWLFGRRSPQDNPRIPPAYLFLAPGDGEHSVQVVGESNYQASLRWAARGTNTEGPNNSRVYAEVIPDPTNRYDSNAVRIQVGGRLVGYLARADAAAYQSLLLPFAASGRIPACEARIKGGYTTDDGFHASLGIELYMGRPDELATTMAGPAAESAPR
jgi:hypothetical protein